MQRHGDPRRARPDRGGVRPCEKAGERHGTRWAAGHAAALRRGCADAEPADERAASAGRDRDRWRRWLAVSAGPEGAAPEAPEAFLACPACLVSPASHRCLALHCPKSRPLPARTEVYEGVVQDLIDELGQLPGIGPKGAQRIAFHLLTASAEDVRRLSATLIEVIEKVKFCRTCGNVAENDECRICLDVRRDHSLICVVEEPKDVAAIEKIREFRGRYHVLGGAISPMDGVGPEDLRISELMARLADGAISEVILATDPNLEGEATATYLARLIKPLGLRVTRPASGLPVGGDLEYADEVTLGRAFEGRRLLDV